MVNLQWYPVPDYFAVFPYPHAFASINYSDNYSVIEGVGEQDEEMSWTPDQYQPYAGLNFCGEADWFLNGIPEDAPTYQEPCALCTIPKSVTQFIYTGVAVIRSKGIRIRINGAVNRIIGAFDEEYNSAYDYFREQILPEID